VYCIAVEDGRTFCRTEQGTAYKVDPKQARIIAAEGVYNPFLSPDAPGREKAAPAPAVEPQARLEPVRPDLATISTGKERATAAAYIPPEFHAWNSDPFGSSK